MNMKKWLCLALAALMALGTFALAEGDDLQAQLDAANARIAELEAEVSGQTGIRCIRWRCCNPWCRETITASSPWAN